MATTLLLRFITLCLCLGVIMADDNRAKECTEKCNLGVADLVNAESNTIYYARCLEACNLIALLTSQWGASYDEMETKKMATEHVSRQLQAGHTQYERGLQAIVQAVHSFPWVAGKDFYVIASRPKVVDDLTVPKGYAIDFAKRIEECKFGCDTAANENFCSWSKCAQLRDPSSAKLFCRGICAEVVPVTYQHLLNVPLAKMPEYCAWYALKADFVWRLEWKTRLHAASRSRTRDILIRLSCTQFRWTAEDGTDHSNWKDPQPPTPTEDPKIPVAGTGGDDHAPPPIEDPVGPGTPLPPPKPPSDEPYMSKQDAEARFTCLKVCSNALFSELTQAFDCYWGCNQDDENLCDTAFIKYLSNEVDIMPDANLKVTSKHKAIGCAINLGARYRASLNYVKACSSYCESHSFKHVDTQSKLYNNAVGKLRNACMNHCTGEAVDADRRGQLKVVKQMTNPGEEGESEDEKLQSFGKIISAAFNFGLTV